MAGGQGTRFWPWSVKDRPKQFLPLISEETMLQQTVKRFRKWLPLEKIFIITTEDYLPLVKEQLPSINNSQIIIEPNPRDTAPCIALASLFFLEKDDNEAFAAVPADHYFRDDSEFPQIIKLAENIVTEQERAIVTLGIKPTRPETGYGYIQTEKNVYDDQIEKVKEFIEKPELEKAKQLIEMENIYWNSGIFIWKPSTIKYYMEEFQSGIWEKLSNNHQDLHSKYSLVPNISIDYAILEKAETIYTIPIDFHWDDVGNWTAWERLNKDAHEENLLSGDVHLLSTKNCVIKSDDKKAIVIGVKDLIIVSTENGLLVCHKSEEQKLKRLLKDNIDDTD